jgi:hypothetical protein
MVGNISCATSMRLYRVLKASRQFNVYADSKETTYLHNESLRIVELSAATLDYCDHCEYGAILKSDR